MFAPGAMTLVLFGRASFYNKYIVRKSGTKCINSSNNEIYYHLIESMDIIEYKQYREWDWDRIDNPIRIQNNIK